MKKIFKMLLVTVIGCFGFTISASAEEYGTEFQKLVGDGTITITSSSLGSKGILVSKYLESWNLKNNTIFVLGLCNESYDACTIALDDSSGNTIEQHEIQINYQEKYSDQFLKLAPNGIVTINSTTVDDKLQLLYSKLGTYTTDEYAYMLDNFNDARTRSDVVLYKKEKTENGISYVELERHSVTFNYKEEFSEEFQKVAKDGRLTINGDTVGTTVDMVRGYVGSYTEYKEVSYTVGQCNEDTTICDVIFSTYYQPENSEYYATREVERHAVKITYNKTYSDKFKEVTDGTITLKSGTIGQKGSLLSYYLDQFCDNYYGSDSEIIDRYSYRIGICNADGSICDVVLYRSNSNSTTSKEIERHAVKVVYKEEYSDEFKKLTDGTITMHSSTIGEKRNLISNYVSTFSSDEYGYSVVQCNDDVTMCDVVLRKNVQTDNYYTSKEIERHAVKIVYGEEQFSDVFKRLTSNNQLVIKSIKPSSSEEADLMINAYLKSFNTENGIFYLTVCNDDYTVCDITSSETGETHALNITYESNLDASILKIVNDMIAKYPEGKMFLVEDLELINYIVSKNYSKDFGNENEMINFSSEAKAYLGNMTGILDARMGWSDPFTSGCAGGFAIIYNNIIYGMLTNGGAQQNNIIYIPETTEDTKEAYIAAAQKRINTYLKNENVKVTYGGKVSEYVSDESEIEWVSGNLGFDISKIESYYNVTYNENTVPFLIIKDSSKVKEEVEYKNDDIITGISISTTSPDVPLDTIIQTTEITKEDTQYQEITTKLNVKEALIYDLKLFSSTTKQFISKLKDGLFQVKIPIPESMLNKNLVAYYIHDDGTIEEHPITVMDGLAHFTTYHFSIYTIAEKREVEDTIKEPVPNTYDGIMNYVGLGVVGLIGLSITGLTYKKKENK